MSLTLLFLIAMIAFATLLTRRVGSYMKTRVQASVRGSSGQVRVKCRTTSVSGFLTLQRLLRLVATPVLCAEQALKNFGQGFASAPRQEKFNVVAFRLGGFSTFCGVHIGARYGVDQLRLGVAHFRQSPNFDSLVWAPWMCFAGVLKR